MTLAPVGTFLGWTLVPAAAVAGPVALLGSVLPAEPVGRGRIEPPVAAILLAVIGVFAITAGDVNLPVTPMKWWPVLLRGGGACVSIAIALLLTIHTKIRLLLAPLLGASLAAFADLHTAATIGVLLVCAVSLRWAVQVVRVALSLAAVTAFVSDNHPWAKAAPASSTAADPALPGQRGELAADHTAQTQTQRIVDQPWAALRDS